MIVDEAIAFARELCRGELAQVRIERLVVGIYFTFLELTSGACGLAMTETEAELASQAGRGRIKGPFSPGTLRHHSLVDILDHPEKRPVFNSIRWALVNACSSHLEATISRRIRTDRDVLDYVDCSDGRRITLVGAFNSIMNALSQRSCTCRVLELKPEMIASPHRHLHVPVCDSKTVLSASDTVIITGSTLVNRTLDSLLEAVSPSAQVVLIGPSAGVFPDLLFDRRVSLIGTIRITNADEVFRMVCEGGSGYHMYSCCAKKIIIEHDR